MRRWIWLVLLLLLIPVASADASDVLQGTDCIVPAETTIQGNVYALCRTLRIDGVVEGDVFAAAITASIEGRVEGSVYLAAGKLRVTGSVTGKIHFAGGILHILPEAQLGEVATSVYSGALSTQIDAPVPGNIGALGYQLLIAAPVQGPVDFAGTALFVNADVGGDITASVGSQQTSGVQELQSLIQLVDEEVRLQPPGLVVTENATVVGTITYSSTSPGIINGQVSEVVFTQVVPEGDALAGEPDFGTAVRTYVQQMLREFITLFLTGAVVVTIAPRFIQSPIALARNRPLTSVSAGLLVFILSFPVLLLAVVISLLLVLLVSLIGYDSITLLTAVVLAAINFAGVALFYFVALFISRVVISVAIGRVVLTPVYRARGRMIDAYAQLAAGALVLALLTALPYIGAVTTAAAAFLGLGAIVSYLQRPARQTAAAVARPERELPPPPPDAPPEPGESNLPEGFKWWK